MSQNFTPSRGVSTRRGATGMSIPDPKNHSSGLAAAGLEMPHPSTGGPPAGDPFQPTVERQVQPYGSTSTSQPIPVPVLRSGAEPMSLTMLLGRPTDEVPERVEEGDGPRLVILQDIVRGFPKGRVVWASSLLGYSTTDEKNLANARSDLGRYVGLGAVREATLQEADAYTIKFIEGEEELAQALINEQSQAAVREQENQRFRTLLSDAGIDPDLPPEEIQLMLSERLGGTSAPAETQEQGAVEPVAAIPVEVAAPRPTPTVSRATSARPITTPAPATNEGETGSDQQ